MEDRLAQIAAAIELLASFKASLTAALAQAKEADRLADGIVAVPWGPLAAIAGAKPFEER